MSDVHAERSETQEPTGEMLCPQCETGFLALRQCQLVCDRCGYVESCEDNFVPTQLNP
jgi:ribosomal protein S27AE